MKDHKMRIFIFCIFFISGLSASGQSAANEFFLSCPNVTPESANCLVAHKSAKRVAKATVAIAGKVTQDYSYNPFKRGKDSTHISFLVDVSDPSRKQAIAAARSIIEEIVKADDGKTSYALAEFSSNLNPLVVGPAKPDDILPGLKAVTASGQATELFSNSINAIEAMKSIDSTRKILFLFSDGRFEDTAYSVEQVVRQATSAGVVIYAIGFPETQSATPDLQSMRRLSGETSGLFWMASPGKFNLPLGYPASIFEHFDNGGLLAIGGDFSNKVSAMVTLTYEDGSKEVATKVLNLPVSSEKRTLYSQAISSYFKFSDSVAAALRLKKMVVRWILGCLVFVLALCLIWALLSLMRRRLALSEGGENPNQENLLLDEAIAPGRVLGVLVYQVDGQPVEQEIRSRHFTIGRNGDCDFAVDSNEDSVSRDHAHIHFNKDGDFILVDLDSLNGVFVSDDLDRQKITQHKLNDSDRFWLGDFEVQFFESDSV